MCGESSPFNHYQEEYAFLDSLSELWYNILTNCFLNPCKTCSLILSKSMDLTVLLLLLHVDPDTHFFNDVQHGYVFRNSDYYFENPFPGSFGKIGITHDAFSIIHVNIHSTATILASCVACFSNLKHRVTQIQIQIQKIFPPVTYDIYNQHDDVIKWKHLPRYWPFVRGIHRSPVNSPHKGQWRGALMFFHMFLNKRFSKQP